MDQPHNSKKPIGILGAFLLGGLAPTNADIIAAQDFTTDGAPTTTLTGSTATNMEGGGGFTNTGRANIGDNTGGINITDDGNETFNNKITGNTDITHSGAGTLKLGGGGVDHDFVGTITVGDGGTLRKLRNVDQVTSLGDVGNTFSFTNVVPSTSPDRLQGRPESEASTDRRSSLSRNRNRIRKNRASETRSAFSRQQETSQTSVNYK